MSTIKAGPMTIDLNVAADAFAPIRRDAIPNDLYNAGVPGHTSPITLYDIAMYANGEEERFAQHLVSTPKGSGSPEKMQLWNQEYRRLKEGLDASTRLAVLIASELNKSEGSIFRVVPGAHDLLTAETP